MVEAPQPALVKRGMSGKGDPTAATGRDPASQLTRTLPSHLRYASSQATSRRSKRTPSMLAELKGVCGRWRCAGRAWWGC